MPRLAYVLLAGDPSHPEWAPALAELEQLCIMSGHERPVPARVRRCRKSCVTTWRTP